MVYPGHPSRGCYTCRSRKVKCDETKPICLRCTKARRHCEGYRDSGANNNIPEKQGAAPGSNIDMLVAKRNSQPTAPGDEFWGSIWMNTQFTILLRYPTTALDRVNLHRLYAELVRLPQAACIYGGCLTYIPQLSPSLVSSSPLLPALSALILAFVVRKDNSKHAQEQAITSYHRALQLIRQIIDRNTTRRRNEVILTIQSIFNPHLGGAIAFVKSQDLVSSQDETSKGLYIALLTRFMSACLIIDITHTVQEFPFTMPELLTLHDALLQTPFVSPRSQLQVYLCKLAILHLQISEAASNLSSGHTSSTTITGILDSINATTHQLSQWPGSLPTEWIHNTMVVPSEDWNLWMPVAHVYSSFWAANDWTRYRALQICTCHLRLRFYHLLTATNRVNIASISLGSLSNDISMTRVKIRNLANDICASMLYHLGYRCMGSTERQYPIEAYPQGKYARLTSASQVTWPLYVAGIVEGVEVTQRMWIARQLGVIGDEIGVKQGSAMAEVVRELALRELRPGPGSETSMHMAMAC
ncbi:hypothetical protein BDV38DRAFT_277147 [Aspergillus pseudotamarii]|uniref:Zn(2)-C6 fungal-type domain-containing protein n=1 Tax=Aspergillus pseudotamarii TaxID=132259 RepID=A0A5N6T9S1_ASPPS|nr:uncharacterized protein BDV38DRAFT_277147 [Aspergillus pseudotamarii]KAE8143118.1 hypothetical protein BDV38DRAFT_277147 [Aspergillus pseudotamarii]